MKTVCVMESVSRENGGIFEAELALQKNAQAHLKLDVEVVGLQDASTTVDMPRWQPIVPRTFSMAGPRAIAYSPGLAAGINETKADVAYVAGLWKYPAFAALRWAGQTKRPMIIAPHGMLDPWALRNSAWKKRFALWLFQDRQLRQAACLRALCTAEVQAIRSCGIKSPIAVVPNGVELPDLGGAARRPECFPPGRQILFYLGRLHPKKGLLALLRAWSTLHTRYPDWLLVIAGWDQNGHAAQLQRAASEWGLPWTSGSTIPGPSAAVSFPGPQFGPAKNHCLRACDAVVLPSQSEGLPMVILEAWSHARPVLMTPACNLPEGAQTDAALYAEPNTASLAAQLPRLLGSSPTDRLRMGQRGRDLVESRYQWRDIAGQMGAVYDWVVGSGPAPGFVEVQKS